MNVENPKITNKDSESSLPQIYIWDQSKHKLEAMALEAEISKAKNILQNRDVSCGKSRWKNYSNVGKVETG